MNQFVKDLYTRAGFTFLSVKNYDTAQKKISEVCSARIFNLRGKNMNRNFLSLAVAAQIILTGALYSSSANAAPRCSIRTLVEESASAPATASGFTVSKLDGVEKIKLKAATITKLKKVFDKRGYELEATTIKEVIEGAADLIKGRARGPSIERANKMAEIGREILAAAKSDLNPAQTKMVTYMIAESVLRLEAIKMTEYKPTDDLPVFKKQSTVHINKFHDLAESYVDGTSLYADMSQDGGFLGWVEIRGLYSNNSWAIGLRHHDMYHLFYSYGHPYYLAINLHTSRSINDRRYLMVSSLWEAVDTFRTGYESSIANYFKRQGMTAEEGMLFIGSATQAELDAIDQAIGTTDSINSAEELSYSKGWRPVKTKFGRGTTNYNEKTYNAEIEAYINESIKRLKVRGNQKYGNYHRQGPGIAIPADESAIP